MRPDQRGALPHERCVQIARWVLPAGTSDEEIEREAEQLQAFVAQFPPPTQEQLDRVAVLLRPESWGPTVHTAERGPR